MTGARLQLSAKGSQDVYLTGNPLMTYFKTVYKRHTNFALESKKINFDYFTNLQYTSNTTSTVKLEKLGDLITNMFLVFDLPDILSESDRKFSWIKYIGLNILNKVSISIGGTLIDEQYSEWMFIWNELTLSKEKKELYYKLIGHEKELYEPQEAYNRNSFYPECGFEDTKEVSNLNEDTGNIEYRTITNHSYLKPPSIPSRQIFVPLNFWFTSNYGLSLPLIGLQYHDISMTFEFKSISELYTLLVSYEDIKNYGISTIGDKDTDKFYLEKYTVRQIINNDIRIKPDISNPTHQIKNFLSESLTLPIRKNKNEWDLKPHLEITYAYLDEQERKIFTNNKHDYLIHQVKRVEKIGIFGNTSIKLNFNNPVKELIWVCYRSDRKENNDFNNYTNWEDPNIPQWQNSFSKNNYTFPGYIDIQEGTYWSSTLGGANIRIGRDPTLGYLYIKKLVNKQDSNGNNIINSTTGEIETTYIEIARFDTSYDTPPPQQSSNIKPTDIITNYENNKKNIIKKVKLLLNNYDRFSEKEYEYFNKLQPYLYHKGIPTDGIMVYSFALDPESIHPSGSCNFTQLNNKQLNIETIIPPTTNNKYDYLFNINIYALTYNILSIQSGMAGLVFI